MTAASQPPPDISDSDAESSASTVSQYTELVPGQPRFFGCYMLVSQSPRTQSRNKSYIGFTVNPVRRLRQHNGELKNGGARRTAAHRPWQMVMVIHGFSCRTQALSFEWAWTNPQRTRALAAHRGRTSFPRSPQGRLLALAALCAQRPWRNCPLTLTVLTGQSQWDTMCGTGNDAVCMPGTLRIDFRALAALGDLARYDFRAGSAAAVPHERPGGGCAVCAASVAHDAPQARAQCFHCGVLACLVCLAECELEVQGNVNEDGDNDRLVPDNVFCPACRKTMDWAMVVRLSRALAAEAAATEDALLAAGVAVADTSVPVA